MKTLGKWALLLITVLPALFFASCNDDDDDNNNKSSDTPQIKKIYDKQGDTTKKVVSKMCCSLMMDITIRWKSDIVL